MKGDPAPVCCYCRDYTPEAGLYVEALNAWVCHGCLPTKNPPSNVEYRAAIASIRMAI